MSEKDMLVYQYTNGRTQHSSEMHMHECQSLINFLSAKQGAQQVTVAGRSAGKNDVFKRDRMRKKILSICHELNWETPEGAVDFPRLEKYLEKYGYKHKTNLNSYTTEELPTLVTQFENMLRTQLRSKRNAR